MMWLTWRQFRAQIIWAVAALAVLAGVLAYVRPGLTHLYDANGIATCGVNTTCPALVTRFLDEVAGIKEILYFLGIGLMFAVPAIIGMFWGAPLIAREIDTHTYKLAWNQSITRTRWLTVKLAVIGLAAMATAGLLSLMMTWYSGPIDQALTLNPRHGLSLTRLGPILFDTRGVTPIAYAAFAFALGVAAGALIRRTIPAIAATLTGFAVIQIAMTDLIRQHLVTPIHTIVMLNTGNIDGIGQAANGGMLVKATPSIGLLHLRQQVTYVPASRYWTMQWREAAVFAVLTLLLSAVCLWAISRRHVA